MERRRRSDAITSDLNPSHYSRLQCPEILMNWPATTASSGSAGKLPSLGHGKPLGVLFGLICHSCSHSSSGLGIRRLAVVAASNGNADVGPLVMLLFLDIGHCQLYTGSSLCK